MQRDNDMMKWQLLLIIGVSWLLSACSTAVVPSNEYLLKDTKLESISPLSTRSDAIQLSSVSMANYLSGNEIVLVTKAGAVHRSKTNLWAESLASQLSRLTQQRLENALPNVTWFGGQRLPSYMISVLSIEVDEFYADLEGIVHISGRWQMISELGELSASNTFHVNNKLKSDGYVPMVQTLADSWFNQVIADMVQEIAQALGDPE